MWRVSIAGQLIALNDHSSQQIALNDHSSQQTSHRIRNITSSLVLWNCGTIVGIHKSKMRSPLDTERIYPCHASANGAMTDPTNCLAAVH
jgi:hypothetical protein